MIAHAPVAPAQEPEQEQSRREPCDCTAGIDPSEFTLITAYWQTKWALQNHCLVCRPILEQEPSLLRF